ncbi:MAG: ATP-binding protein [Anaerolineales bacterium]|nr:ATP-binding protein [Anaerolineales bacterium]
MSESRGPIGFVVGGSLKDNLKVRLTVPPDRVQEGAFVVIESGFWLFYGLVTDLRLSAVDDRYAEGLPAGRLPDQLENIIREETLSVDLEVLPALMLERGPDPGSDEYHDWKREQDAKSSPQRARPVKTVPLHHAPVRAASSGDIEEIFGQDKKGYFVLGNTREQGHPVRINLAKFIQRSSGIFGATGTGKSFLTRMVLAGLIHFNAASVLVFDMHNEYGFDDTASDTGQRVIGLKTKFPGRVRVVGLGRGAQIRGQSPDFNLEIPLSALQPADIMLLSRELNLRETTPATLDALVKTFGRDDWFREFRDLQVGTLIDNGEGKMIPAPGSVAHWANANGVNIMAAEALHSKLRRVFGKNYLVENPAADGIREIVNLLEGGQHVILSFGKYESDLDYLLVSNLLTRTIRRRWEKLTNDFRSSGKEEPQPLVLVVEEAHKLLNREMAAQTTFSRIARELRKYYVTLLIVDQRPSQIYDEVMSQLGTRISGWLGDEEDIRAVLSGLAGRQALRGMLSRLQPKEEVLLLGWGVPMPLPIRSRRYNEDFWKELIGDQMRVDDQSAEDSIKELGF